MLICPSFFLFLAFSLVLDRILERQLEIARKRNERLSDMVEQLH